MINEKKCDFSAEVSSAGIEKKKKEKKFRWLLHVKGMKKQMVCRR